MSRSCGLYALEHLTRLPEQRTHELPLGDGLFRVSAKTIVSVSLPRRRPRYPMLRRAGGSDPYLSIILVVLGVSDGVLSPLPSFTP